MKKKIAPPLSVQQLRAQALLEEMTGLGVRVEPNETVGTSYIFQCKNPDDLGDLSTFVRGFTGLNTGRAPSDARLSLRADPAKPEEHNSVAVEFHSSAGIPWSDEAAAPMVDALYEARKKDVPAREWPKLQKEQRGYFRFEDALAKQKIKTI